MAGFRALELTASYDIIDGETGHSRTQGISGAAAMARDWSAGDEAWPAGEQDFRGQPVEVAA